MGVASAWLRARSAPLSRRLAPPPATDDDLFDDEFQRKLDYLALVSRRVFAGRMRAERRTKKSGSGVEFADHRDYAPGDDFRYLDWNVYQRFDRLLVRLYEEEEDLAIYFIVDASRVDGRSATARSSATRSRLVRGARLRRASRTSTASAIVTDDRRDQRAHAGDARQGAHLQGLPLPARASRPTGTTDLGDAHEDLRRAEQAARARRARQRSLRPGGLRAGHQRAPLQQVRAVRRPRRRPARGAARSCAATCASTTARRATSARSPSPPRCSSASPRRYEEYLAEVERFCATRQVPLRPRRRRRPVRRAHPARLPPRRVPPVAHALRRPPARARSLQIFALAGAAVVVFYILKLRRRPVAVPVLAALGAHPPRQGGDEPLLEAQAAALAPPAARAPRAARPRARRSARRRRASSRGATSSSSSTRARRCRRPTSRRAASAVGEGRGEEDRPRARRRRPHAHRADGRGGDAARDR